MMKLSLIALISNLVAGQTIYTAYEIQDGAPPNLNTGGLNVPAEECGAFVWGSEADQLATIGVYDDMHHAVIVDHSGDGNVMEHCGDIYKIRDNSETQRYSYAMVVSVSADAEANLCETGEICLMTRVVTTFDCTGPCDIGTAIDVKLPALKRTDLLDDVAGALFLDGDISTPAGCDPFTVDDDAKPMIAVEIDSDDVTSMGVSMTDPCGKLFNVIDDDGTSPTPVLMQIVGLEVATNTTGKYVFMIASGSPLDALEAGTCVGFCGEAACNDLAHNVIAATCNLVAEEEGEVETTEEEGEVETTEEEGEVETTGDEEGVTTDEEGDTTTSSTDSTAKPEGVLTVKPYQYSWCNKETSCGWVPILPDDRCGGSDRPCVAEHLSYIPVDNAEDEADEGLKCGSVVKLTEVAPGGGEVYVQFVHFENTASDTIKIDHEGWVHLCPNLCANEDETSYECSTDTCTSGGWDGEGQGECTCIACDSSAPGGSQSDLGGCQGTSCPDCSGACTYVPNQSLHPDKTESKTATLTFIEHGELPTRSSALPLAVCAAVVAPLL